MDVEMWDWWESWQTDWELLEWRYEQMKVHGEYGGESDFLWHQNRILEDKWEAKIFGASLNRLY